MAYMDQKQKKELSPGIKAVLEKYNVKASIAVRHHSTLIVNIRSSEIDFGNSRAPTPANTRRDVQWTGHEQVNPYWLKDHWTGNALEFLLELKAAMSVGNHDRSDLQSDYHDVGWYTEINIGQWNKPYELEAA
jgi:hypothetical protein